MTKFSLPENFEESAKRPLFSLPENFDADARVRLNKHGNIIADRPKGIVKTSLEGRVGSRVNASNYTGNGHWQWVPGEELGTRPGYTGFIYVIHDKINNMLYLGKKQYRGAGKQNKGQMSNWRWYISSSTELSAAVKKHGKEHFDFIAIEEYKAKGALSYAEVWSLLFAQTPVYQHKWYNVLINKVSWKVTEPPTARHRRRLITIMNRANAPHDFKQEDIDSI